MKAHFLSIIILLLVSTSVFSLSVSSDLVQLKEPQSMPFVEHVVEDDPTSFGNSLALSIPYAPIIKLRKIIEKQTGKKLDYFRGWDPAGEAHVTTITPPDFVKALRHGITMKRINEIAREEHIQDADIKLLGIGSAKKTINGIVEETFFVIVDSSKLRSIRYKIYKEFIDNKGDPKSFDPTWFFPHITIGYTLKDLHEPDALKDIKHSLDSRFEDINTALINLN